MWLFLFLPSRVSALAHTGEAGRTRRNVMIEVLTASVPGFALSWQGGTELPPDLLHGESGS
jgi:hypothetical protein